MPKNKSMRYQVSQKLYEKQKFGESKHEAKQQSTDRYTEGIYSKQTMKNYIDKATQFANWCKAEYGCKTLDDCKPYAQAYIDSRSHLSPYTLKLDVSAIKKLYNREIDLKSEKSRNRGEIRRSRTHSERSLRAEQKNPVLKEFCQATGLRRHELEALRGCDIKISGDKVFVQVQQGKGGKFRSVEVTEKGINLVKQFQSTSTNLLFQNIDKNFDVHMYRGDYAKELYHQFFENSNKTDSERNWYYCRGDKKGIKYDREIMLKVSQNLGHDRVNVIAGHYL